MKYFVSIILIVLPFAFKANNLRITNVSQNQTNGEVSFDLAWDNSWRIDGMGTPNHWDAAWVFVKFRECGVSATTPWTHGLVNTTVASHTLGGLTPTTSDGATGIDAAPNNTGIMLRRGTTGLFPNSAAESITLDITNFPATGNYEVKVFGIEMVFVPQGDFVAGGNSEFYPMNMGSNPFVVNSENALTMNYYYSSSTTLPGSFPKGYDPFYLMKYEISQGQYTAFLNTIDATAQTVRFPSFYNTNRHRINSGGTPPDAYYTDRPDRACNYLSWDDLLAYLDWSCLRPMTGLEYEKAARGQSSYLGGYAWGTTNITNVTQLGTPEDGTELALDANANSHYSNTTLTGGDGGRGPLRVGIFATNATTNREQSGASYYGIMELSGNLWEQCVAIGVDPILLAFDGSWGDGSLDAATGTADVTNWPYTNCTSCVRSLRGGSYADNADRLRISDRYYYTYSTSNRGPSIGGRGAR